MNLMRYKIIKGKLHYWNEILDRWTPVPSKDSKEKKEDASSDSDESYEKDYERAMKGL